jgi:ankyrin repeat protein
MEAVAANSTDTVRLLIQHGATISLKDTDGKTAVDMAKRKPHTQLILESAR